MLDRYTGAILASPKATVVCGSGAGQQGSHTITLGGWGAYFALLADAAGATYDFLALDQDGQVLNHAENISAQALKLDGRFFGFGVCTLYVLNTNKAFNLAAVAVME